MLAKRYGTNPSFCSNMTKWHVDNLITHIIALGLTVDNLIMDILDLREDLRLENKQYVLPKHFEGLARLVSPAYLPRIPS